MTFQNHFIDTLCEMKLASGAQVHRKLPAVCWGNLSPSLSLSEHASAAPLLDTPAQAHRTLLHATRSTCPLLRASFRGTSLSRNQSPICLALKEPISYIQGCLAHKKPIPHVVALGGRAVSHERVSILGQRRLGRITVEEGGAGGEARFVGRT